MLYFILLIHKDEYGQLIKNLLKYYRVNMFILNFHQNSL